MRTLDKPFLVRIESDRYPTEEMPYATEEAAKEAYKRLSESAAAWGNAFGVAYTVTYIGNRVFPLKEAPEELIEEEEEEEEEEAS